MTSKSILGHIILGIFIITVIFYGFFSSSKKNKLDYLYKKIDITIGNSVFKAEIADTPALLEQGLSGRASIDEDYAMLFVFPTPGQHKFWMKDMNFPIDIIWLNKYKKIVHIEKNLSPNTYPRAFGPDTDTVYVLEIKSGKADQLDLLINQEIIF